MRSLTLRTQVALLLATLVGGTLLLIGLLFMQQSARALTASIGEDLLNQAHSVAVDLDRELIGLTNQLALASASESFRAQTSRAVRQHDLTLIQSLFPGLTWIGIAGAEGVVQVATGGHLEGADISSRSAFQGGLSGAFLGGRRPALLLQPQLRPDEPAWQVMDVATPLLDEHGHAYGVLVAHLGWDWLVQRHRQAFRERRLDGRGKAWLVDEDGRVIAGPGVGDIHEEPSLAPGDWQQLQRLAAAGGGWQRMEWIDGRDVLLGVARSRLNLQTANFTSYSVVTEDTGAALAPVRDLLLLLALGSVAMAVLAALIGYHLAKRVSAPLHLLARATEQLRQGHAEDIPRIHASREITQLSDALRELIASLQHTRTHLYRAREQAFRDALTGLNNRASLVELIEAKAALTRVSGGSLACANLDLDGFKAVNDHHGHGAGDAILVAVARRMQGAIRSDELAFRLGGDEFLLIFAVPSEQAELDARRVAQRVLDAVQLPVQWEQYCLPVGATLGLSVWPQQGDVLDEVLKQADNALIKGKRKCKGRVWLYGEESPDSPATESDHP